MANVNGDQNLLFGILALQMDFVNRDALIRAMNAWVLDKVKPLGQILEEQGALGHDMHVLLESLVKKHLELHGDDPQRSLAALSSVGSAREALQQVADPDLQTSLGHIPVSPRADAAPNATLANNPAADANLIGRRFRILRPHARGGLGEVFVAVDEELHRDVALKVIREPFADHPTTRNRFLMEAEITGGLEHPGIVPIYGLGQYADGRPFYAMRFIKGDSLKEAVARFHEPAAQGRPAGERALGLRKLLGRFVDVCDAVAYAHSRGVLHRDLKPSNVMLGKYGETLVVDWGLAKAVGRREQGRDVDEQTLRPASSGSAETLPGSAIGTPAYMSPEQASGHLEQMGQASDVYGLGATLYCLLTGKPPFTGPDVVAVLQKVQRGEFPQPRQVNRIVPPALEAVCLKAMALKPEDRYATARALADDVEHWLADEPVSVYREPARARLGRWGRRHKTLVTGGAVLLVTAVVALAGGLLLLGWTQAEVVRERNAARTARDQAEAISKFYEDHVLVAPRPKGWEGGLGKDVTLREALDMAAPKIDEAFAGQPEVEAKVRNTLGSTYWYLGQFEAAYPQLEKAHAIRLERLGPDHPDTLTSLDCLAMERWKQDKLDEAVALERQALEKRRRVLGPEHPDALSSQINLGIFLIDEQEQGTWDADAVQLDEANSLLTQAVESCIRTLGPDHSQTLYGQMGLYWVLDCQGKMDEALALVRQTLERRRRSLGPDHPDTLRSLCNVATILDDAGKQFDEAEALARQSLEARRRVLGEGHIETFKSLDALASILTDKGKQVEAEAVRRCALKDCQRLRGPDDPRTLNCLTALGNFLRSQGKLDEAGQLLQQAVELSHRKLGPEHGDTLFRQRKLAQLLAQQGKANEAEALYRQTLGALRRVRGPEHTNTLGTQNDLAAFLWKQGKLDEAEQLYRDVLEIRRRVLGPDRPDTVKALDNLADLLQDRCDLGEADQLYREELAVQRNTLPAADVGLGSTLASLGGVLIKKRAAKDAEPLLRECLDIRQKGLPKGDWQISNTESLLGGCLSAQGQYADAEPLLLGSYENLKSAPGTPAERAAEALTRITKLYDAWGKPEQAAAWRAKENPPAKPADK